MSFLSLNLLDAHGAGAQRSHQKPDVRHAAGIGVFNLGAGPFHFLGASGEILRVKNQVRCVRNVG
ncbi:hypothetical protein [Photobacterium sp. 1_MG-2023]|uniref:hypothetical protein n=1 Tax=Photobacterium sp. 1_MG-2023 TaxID=3062646 RepID=UPI0026E26E3B|nr:hypothetical protein [Photobacterium sp. 1_MG-2023]MDO6708597.1 hypothetical protein [Photobacterium sp. 1_MG-2023]